jgi:RNA polymerase sigma-70 factor (ECF subfamily)
VIDTLKPEQSQLLRSAYVEGRSIGDLAVELETNRNNAGVKLHRARQALKDALVTVCRSCAAHGCLDCSCRKGRPLVEPV